MQSSFEKTIRRRPRGNDIEHKKGKKDSKHRKQMRELKRCGGEV